MSEGEEKKLVIMRLPDGQLVAASPTEARIIQDQLGASARLTSTLPIPVKPYIVPDYDPAALQKMVDAVDPKTGRHRTRKQRRAIAAQRRRAK